jgi:hypothetical protein
MVNRKFLPNYRSNYFVPKWAKLGDQNIISNSRKCEIILNQKLKTQIDQQYIGHHLNEHNQ